MFIYLLKVVIFQFANCKRLPGGIDPIQSHRWRNPPSDHPNPQKRTMEIDQRIAGWWLSQPPLWKMEFVNGKDYSQYIMEK